MMHDINIKLLSVVVPIFNEGPGLEQFNGLLVAQLSNLDGVQDYEIIYCNDGSTDNSVQLVESLRNKNKRIKLVTLSRNFGKEAALAAGITHAMGDAILTMDGDGQHPPDVIPRFIQQWKDGCQIVIGLRHRNKDESPLRRWFAKRFYAASSLVSTNTVKAGTTDFCLLDRAVQQAFLGLDERDRVTRDLIEWLGFKKAYVSFDAPERLKGSSRIGNKTVFKLAIDSFVSISPIPLYLFGYVGIVITFVSFLLGVSILIEQLLLSDPLNWNFTGTAMLSTLILFLIGIVLMSQGMLSLYIARIHRQSQQRPLFVIDYQHSAGIDNS